MDILKCSKHLTGDLSLLAGLLDVTDKQLQVLQEQYKSPVAQAVQLLKKWRTVTQGTKQQLCDILIAAEFDDAAKMYVKISCYY